MIRVVYFSTSERSLILLKKLKESAEIEVVLCVTKTDVRVGRHQELKANNIRLFCKQEGIKVVPISSSSELKQESILEEIKCSKPALGFSVDFSFIIPEEIINTFPKEILNLHFSLLPKYRGASPAQFTVLNGDAIGGVTFHLMEKGLDTGPIVQQIPHQLAQTETSAELIQTLYELSSEHVLETIINYYNGKLTPLPQNHAEASYTYSPTQPKRTFIFKEDAKIDWTKPLAQIERAIRAYNPWPIVHTTLQELADHKYMIRDFTAIKDSKHAIKLVKIRQARVSGSQLELLQLQPEGSKILTWDEFKNGYLTKF